MDFSNTVLVIYNYYLRQCYLPSIINPPPSSLQATYTGIWCITYADVRVTLPLGTYILTNVISLIMIYIGIVNYYTYTIFPNIIQY